MKIVVIGPVYPYRGGIAHYTTLLVKALQDAGHDVKVISFKRQYPKWLYPGESDRDPSQQPLTVPAAYLLDPLYPWTWQQAVNAAIAESPDLVLFQWWTTFWALAFAFISQRLKAKNIRVGYLIHNVIPHEARPWDKFLAKMALRQGDGFIVQSVGQENVLRKLFPVARIEQVEHPIYDMFAGQIIEKKIARQKLGVPETLPLVLFFGIVRPYKGLKQLVQAVGQLSSEGVNVGLYVAGEFWEDIHWYQQEIIRLGLTDRVWIDNRYIPNEELPTIFSAADVFAAPYTDATQSGAVKMALGFGLPLIISKAVATDQSFYHSDAIKVVPSMDCLVLKEAIKQWLSGDWTHKRYTSSQNGWDSLLGKILWLSNGSLK